MVAEDTSKTRVHGSFHFLDAVAENELKYMSELIKRFGEPIVYAVGSNLYMVLDNLNIVKISKFIFRIDGEDVDEN